MKKVELQGEKKGKDEQIVNLDEFSFLRPSLLHSIVLLSSLLLFSHSPSLLVSFEEKKGEREKLEEKMTRKGMVLKGIKCNEVENENERFVSIE